MSAFVYQARDNKNATVTGTVEAMDQKEAMTLLRKKNFFVVNIQKKQQTFFKIGFPVIKSQVKFNDIVIFTRQLSTMITAGLLLPDALTILEKQTTNVALQNLVHDLNQSVSSGLSLTTSLLKYKGTFSPIYIALIRAGEASGSLDVVLERLADTLESQKEFRAKIIGALIYPCIIILGMVGVVIVMMTVVIPKLSDMYREFGLALPLPTQILIAISNFTITFWWLMLLVLGVSISLFIRWKKTPVGRYFVDSFILKIPVIGNLVSKVILVEFTRTFSMLTTSGIHVLEGLKMLKASSGNIKFEDSINDITSKVERGFSLGDSFAAHDIYPPIVQQMIRVGEETGKLDDTLFKLSKYFQSESESLIKGLTTAIEPVIMVVLGVGVGFVVISVITPIYNLTSNFR